MLPHLRQKSSVFHLVRQRPLSNRSVGGAADYAVFMEKTVVGRDQDGWAWLGVNGTRFVWFIDIVLQFFPHAPYNILPENYNSIHPSYCTYIEGYFLGGGGGGVLGALRHYASPCRSAGQGRVLFPKPPRCVLGTR